MASLLSSTIGNVVSCLVHLVALHTPQERVTTVQTSCLSMLQYEDGRIYVGNMHAAVLAEYHACHC